MPANTLEERTKHEPGLLVIGYNEILPFLFWHKIKKLNWIDLLNCLNLVGILSQVRLSERDTLIHIILFMLQQIRTNLEAILFLETVRHSFRIPNHRQVITSPTSEKNISRKVQSLSSRARQSPPGGIWNRYLTKFIRLHCHHPLGEWHIVPQPYASVHLRDER